MSEPSAVGGEPLEASAAPRRKTVRNLVVIAILAGLVLGGSCFAVVASGIRHGLQLDSSSKAYVEDVMPKLLGFWDYEALASQSSPEMLAAASPEQLKRLFDAGSHALGPLKQLGAIKGDSAVMVTNSKAKTTARYRVEAQFARGSAMIDVALIQHDGRWQVLGFHVNSDAFLKP